MIQRPRTGFLLVTAAGFLLILGNGISASVPVLNEFTGVAFFFAGWALVSAVIWLAAVSAAYAVIGKSPAFPGNQVHIAAQLIAAGIQVSTFLFPHAAAGLAWMPQSQVLNFFTLVYVYSGPVLIGLGLIVGIWALIQRSRYRGKTSVRIRVMHMHGHWPVWFDNELMDEMDKAPISTELKNRGVELSQLFESLAVWDDENTRFEWISDLAKDQFNKVSRSFAQDLATELGPEYFVVTEVQRSNRNVAQLEQEIY